MATEYKLVTRGNPESLEVAVNEMLADGWKLQDGCTYGRWFEDAVKFQGWAQAMTRELPEAATECNHEWTDATAVADRYTLEICRYCGEFRVTPREQAEATSTGTASEVRDVKGDPDCDHEWRMLRDGGLGALCDKCGALLTKVYAVVNNQPQHIMVTCGPVSDASSGQEGE